MRAARSQEEHSHLQLDCRCLVPDDDHISYSSIHEKNVILRCDGTLHTSLPEMPLGARADSTSNANMRTDSRRTTFIVSQRAVYACGLSGRERLSQHQRFHRGENSYQRQRPKKLTRIFCTNRTNPVSSMQARGVNTRRGMLVFMCQCTAVIILG